MPSKTIKLIAWLKKTLGSIFKKRKAEEPENKKDKDGDTPDTIYPLW